MGEVTVRGWDEVKAKLLGQHGPVYGLAVRVSSEIRNETVRNLNNGMVRVRTGRLKGSIEEHVTLEGHRRITFRVGTRVKYALPVHNGRRAIEATPGHALKLTLPNGQVIFRKRVAAAPARPFLHDAVRKVAARYGVHVP